MIFFRYIFCLLICTTLFFSAFSSFANEDKRIGLSIDQTVFALSSDPGMKSEMKINVRNTSNRKQKMSISVEDFIGGDDGKIKNMTIKNEQFGMSEWVSSKENDWILESQETKEVTLFVNVPKDATVGAHYAIANIRTFPEIDGQNFQNTIVGGQIGVYILLNVNGNVSGSGNLKKFSAPIIFDENVPFQADFENTGNILYIPYGEVKIKNLITQNESIVKSEKHFVFPGKKYSFEMKWNEEDYLGIYKAQASFIDGNGKAHTQARFLFGKFVFGVPFVFMIVILFFLQRKRGNKKSKKIIFHNKKHHLDH